MEQEELLDRIKSIMEKKSVFQKEMDIASDVGIKYNLQERLNQWILSFKFLRKSCKILIQIHNCLIRLKYGLVGSTNFVNLYLF